MKENDNMKKLFSLLLITTLLLTSIIPVNAKNIPSEVELEALMNKMTKVLNDANVDYTKSGYQEWIVTNKGVSGTVSVEIEKIESIGTRAANNYEFDDGDYTSTVTYNVNNGTFKLQTQYTISNNETYLKVTDSKMYASPPSGYNVGNKDSIIEKYNDQITTIYGTATLSCGSVNFTVEITERLDLWVPALSDGTNLTVSYWTDWH